MTALARSVNEKTAAASKGSGLSLVENHLSALQAYHDITSKKYDVGYADPMPASVKYGNI